MVGVRKVNFKKGKQMLDTKECSGKVIDIHWLIDKGNVNSGNRCYEIGTVGHKWVKMRPPQSYTLKKLGIESNWTRVSRSEFDKSLAWNQKNEQDMFVTTPKKYSRKSKWEA
tara:strand:- start:5458 stop:5793 length:336 start_codon:yes stop_codon:yes gene_type:complete